MTKHRITIVADGSTLFDALYAFGTDEGLSAIGNALSVPLLTGRMPSLLDAATLGGYAVTVERVEPAVEPFSPDPDGYQWLRDGEWVACSAFVALGESGKLGDDARALYAEPPVDVYKALVDLAAWVEGDCKDIIPQKHIKQAVATAKRRLGL